ncbi:MAG: M48 family metalloprotease [Pseudomonadota bacterium]
MAFTILSQKILLRILLFNLLFWFPLLSGCAVNPATKRTEFMIVSEEQEFRIGQSVDKEVREEMGVYLELPELRSLVKEVGETIGRNSDRPNLIYRIEVVDSPDFNAFVLPGGFIYVHRGLLEKINSVDELASVVGHEISHVAARHSAAQISKAQLMNIGLIGLTVATKGAIQDYGDLINLGAALAFNKFSRDDEREADYFGTKYLIRSGYNPNASFAVMKHIQTLEIREPALLETWFMTHPSTSERLVNLNQAIEEVRLSQPQTLNLPVKRNQYIALLDGLAVGEWNGNELISGERYYNKEFLLSLTIPEGWQAHINSKKYTAVFAQPKKEFYVFFDIEPLRIQKTTEEYFRDFEKRLHQLGLSKVKGLTSHRGLRHGALTGIYTGYDRNRGSITAEGIAFVGGTNGYTLVGSSRDADFKEFQPLVESMLASFQFISQPEASELKPSRLRIHEVKPGETWATITQTYFHSSEGKAKLAEYNGFEVSQGLTAGILLKIPPSLRL